MKRGVISFQGYQRQTIANNKPPFFVLLLSFIVLLLVQLPTYNAQNIVSSTYHIKSISDITNTYSIQVALFDILFDEV
ncbi:hypothetical protein DFA_02613 [Cavenderia fasciculata]|uniref:Uncharacterized protein n=1 Tax=Cavenderia fasciculata TaxID=261658 RepID=F4PZW0_CACFS|nr:uncharacterized protein DFA_02613 [Cavenderia fasciculata]EGG18874.1 hypothetical protein DFA_02613 [Cavenderia fasciculata]|eukprot:XP_004357336.1 hypothetical protein DFA_02613 [Cavenderia fasciculata]